MILSFDIESNGLLGEAFAVGAVLISADHTERSYEEIVIDEFYEVASLPHYNEWVAENVLPNLKNVTCDSTLDLRNKFWTWYSDWKKKIPHIHMFADVGYPVEANFLIQCQRDDIQREFDGPYPLFDLSSVMVSKGYDPYLKRRELFSRIYSDKQFYNKIKEGKEHNPLFDALVSGLIVRSIIGNRLEKWSKKE